MRLSLAVQLALLALLLGSEAEPSPATVPPPIADTAVLGGEFAALRRVLWLPGNPIGSVLLAAQSAPLAHLLLLRTPVSAAAAAAEMRSFAKDELRRHDGSDESLPILMAIQGIVFDVTSGANFYSKQGPYNQLVGRDASRAVGLMSLEQDDLDAEDDLSELDDAAQFVEDLNLVFYETYVRKYPVLGLLDGSRAIPAGKSGAEWWAEVEAKQREAGGPAALQADSQATKQKGDL
jgi:predicted heme/steroid binding protein